MKVLIVLFIIKITLCDYDRRIITTLNYSKYHVETQVTKTSPVQLGQMPYLVSIKEPAFRLNKGDVIWTSACWGTIISKLKVLTAAHCFERPNMYYSKHTNARRLVAGSIENKMIHSGATGNTHKAQWRQIDKMILHKDFAFPENDIAVIYVDVPWQFTDYIDYVTPAIAPDTAKRCYIAGFGRTGQSLLETVTPVLVKAQIIIIPSWKCSELWEIDMSSFICTISVVDGLGLTDSGGPLICSYYEPGNKSRSHILIGVVSAKNYDKTNLFTRVSYYQDWLEDSNFFT